MFEKSRLMELAGLADADDRLDETHDYDPMDEIVVLPTPGPEGDDENSDTSSVNELRIRNLIRREVRSMLRRMDNRSDDRSKPSWILSTQPRSRSSMGQVSMGFLGPGFRKD